MQKKKKQDEEEDKKVVVPPVNRHLLPAANFKPLIQDARAQGRREALCSRCHMSHVILGLRCPPSPLGALEVSIEPQPDRSIALSAQAVQRRWRRRAGWAVGAVRSGHCSRGEEERRLFIVALFSYSPDLLEHMPTHACSVGGSYTG